MKRKFALLVMAVGAILALAAPASSMANMVPHGYKWEIPAGAEGPTLVTSLGFCSLKITGTIPSGETPASLFEVPAPVASSCSTGTSVTIGGKWNLSTTYPTVDLLGGSESIVFRFSSLPSCKLVGGSELSGFWSNGQISTTAPSYYHADSTTPYVWQNDGGSCALSGTETVAYQSKNARSYGAGTKVDDLTSSSTGILVLK